MGTQTLYEEDILLWSEQQAEAIRQLGRTRRHIPNELDIENVAEEIESVGRSELAAVESQIQNILSHLMKLASEPDSPAVRHWRAELAAFHGDMRRRYAPSMRQRINLDQIWTLSRDIAVLASDEPGELGARIPAEISFGLDDLLGPRIDSLRLVEKIRTAAQATLRR